MSRKTELRLIRFLLKRMDDLKDDPGRDQYCAGFDAAYRDRKKRYFELSGSEWDGNSHVDVL